MGRIEDWMRGGSVVAALLLSACASGDTGGFASGAASFGTGGPGPGTAGDDDATETDGDESDGSGAGGSLSGADPSADDGVDDGPGDTGMVGDSSGGADDGPGDGPTCVPSEEVCDGDDNDCDGEVDEDEPGAGDACATGLAGPCGDGVTACEGGAIVCVQVTSPSAEACDGVDNDCNGETDEGDPGGGGACDTGLPGICSAGIGVCAGGSLVCNQSQSAGVESCNSLDDDCDGSSDEGNPGGGGACSTGQPGICAAGTLTCQGGALACVQNQAPGLEVCGNGVDEDCDGAPDDGCGCAHDPCVTGVALVSGCSPCVTSVCASDSFCCTNSWDSICVGEVSSICGQVCQGTCSHSLCVTGTALVSGCVPCVTSICSSDSFCCNNSWDSICVGEVSSICGLTC